MENPKQLELLAPARNLEVGKTAIDCGADAVYMGGPAFGARAAATNSVADIAALAAYAHRFDARVYVTMNTILYEDELSRARDLVWELFDAGVDALIVQDMAYLEMDLPQIALHASTQCDIRTPEKARWLAKAGFSQLVLPREFSVNQIREVAQAVDVPVEVFVHGARCVSYSGDCQMGHVATGRSANRGECPQMCRLPFELTDSSGRLVAPARHYLSLSDLATPDLEPLINAGARSFKIEGRLKDVRYVANATAAYSRMLDDFISRNPDWERASHGRSCPGFTPDLQREFFRRPNGGGMQASLASPKDTGRKVATVVEVDVRRRSFSFRGEGLANGDGLGFFTPDGVFHGFRLNKAEGNIGFAASEINGMTPGTELYRNFDKAFADSVDKATPGRTLPLSLDLSTWEKGLVLFAGSGYVPVQVFRELDLPAANTPQEEARRRVLTKLGGTGFHLESFTDSVGDVFVPASVLADMRREAVQLMEKSLSYKYYFPPLSGDKNLEKNAFKGTPSLTYHDNVANSLARKFYLEHGATLAQAAIETAKLPAGEIRVMQTRYCIRRELGACLQTACGRKLPSPLFLRNKSGVYRLDFDCRRCGMDVIKV